MTLLPAHAGMVPPPSRTFISHFAAPRARGDGPTAFLAASNKLTCSPRTRGWSPHHGHAGAVGRLLPAHAGMVPAHPRWSGRSSPAPRARGDGPVEHRRRSRSGGCSPRTRGWSRLHPGHLHAPLLLPAHAGMVPPWRRTGARPRSAPRARGDGPAISSGWSVGRPCSPRTRGWPPAAANPRPGAPLLPAHAGMIPGCPWGRAGCPAAPRPVRGSCPAPRPHHPAPERKDPRPAGRGRAGGGQRVLPGGGGSRRRGGPEGGWPPTGHPPGPYPAHAPGAPVSGPWATRRTGLGRRGPGEGAGGA
jgi:hypothetical protein